MDNVDTNTCDNTKKLQNSINNSLNKLVQDNKLTKNEAEQLKTSDPNPPIAWTAIEEHKPQKNFPARNVVSHIGCPQEPLAKELIRIIKPLNALCQHNVKNSAEIASLLKKTTLNSEDIFISFDATALFPSIPVNECVNLIRQKLKEDASLHNRT